MSNHSLLLVSIQTQGKALKHERPSKQACFEVRGSWPGVLHSTALRFQEALLLGYRPCLQKNGQGRVPSKTARQHSGKFHKGWFSFSSAVNICPGSCSPSASLGAQNSSSISHPLSQHSPHWLHLLEPFLPHYSSHKGTQEQQSTTTAAAELFSQRQASRVN